MISYDRFIWVLTSCSLVEIDGQFRGAYSFIDLTVEAVGTSEE